MPEQRWHPIPFSVEMVRAILDHRKTQTRRVVTDRTSEGTHRLDCLHMDDETVFVDGRPESGQYLHAPVNVEGMARRFGGEPTDWFDDTIHRVWPRWQVGDRLWVREALECFGAGSRFRAGDLTGWPGTVQYAATITPVIPDDLYTGETDMHGRALWPWKRSVLPSIFMPRWATRLLLEITAVRVERLQDISEEDAVAEGVDAVSLAAVPRSATWNRSQDFAQLWDGLNAKRGYPWESNPWAWVVDFRQVTP